MNFLKDKAFIRFVIKFLVIFLICYYGTFALIGVTVPGGYYSSFIDQYLNYVSWVRISLLNGTKIMLSFFGVDTYRAGEYNLRIVNGRGIRLVYGCLGFGVMSFWVAFVLASADKIKRKLIWTILGLCFIWVLNITRLSLLLVATNKGWPIPLGWDHHTWFTIFSYLFIFILIYLFNRKNADQGEPKQQNKL